MIKDLFDDEFCFSKENVVGISSNQVGSLSCDSGPWWSRHVTHYTFDEFVDQRKGPSMDIC